MQFTISLELKSALKPELARLNKTLEDMARQSDGYLGDLLHYVLIGSGKRIRPALVYLASQLDKSKLDDVHVVEEAVELIHIATLIHDDVIDKAALRRGRKTVAHEHGADTAVLLGDYIYTMAFQKVAKLNQPPLIEILSQAISEVCAGEIEQLKKRFQLDLAEDEYFSFIQKKTASLFGASARCGGVLSGLNSDALSALDAFGRHLGVAFQITDDLLDLTGEEAVVGKTLRTDLLNGKMTLPLIHFRDQLRSEADRNGLFQDLRSPNGQLVELIDRVKSAGSLRYAENVADRQIDLALTCLNDLPSCEARDHLANLARLLHDRKS